MLFRDIFSTALLNLARQRLRALLSIFAIVVGGLLIVLMVSIGNGLTRFIETQVTAFTTPRTISVNPDVAGERFISLFGFGAPPEEYSEDTEKTALGPRPFTINEVEQIRNIEHVEKVAEDFIFTVNYAQLLPNGKKLQALPLYFPEFQSENIRISFGERMRDEYDGKVVIVQQLAEAWGYEDNVEEIIGEKIILHASQAVSPTLLSFGFKPFEPGQLPEEKSFEFEIIGVAEKSLASSLILISRNDAVEIARFINNNPDLYKEGEGAYEISVLVDSADNVEKVDAKLEELGFLSNSYDDILGQLGEVFNIIKIVLSAFGIIALIVASLGITNTMLMAIYERTREIGIMKAVGARKIDIARLFMIEAGFIGLFGGLAGTLIGIGIGQFSNWVLHEYYFLKNYPTLNISIVDISLIFTVLAITTLTAIISGLYPAYKASQLDPIDALRRE